MTAKIQELYQAIKFARTDKIAQLIREGVDLEYQHPTLGTPFLYAAILKKPFILGMLIKAGINVNAVDENGQTALVKAAKVADVETLELLITHGVCADIQDNEGLNAFMHAMLCKKKENAYFLINGYTKWRNRDNNGANALMYAIRAEDPVLVKKLATPKSIIRMQRNKMTPLMIAAEVGNEEIVGILLDAGADTLAETDENKKAIHFADKKSKVYRMIKTAMNKQEKEQKQGNKIGTQDIQRPNNQTGGLIRE